MAQQKTVLLGLSGGVDSAVSAILLQQQGYKVIAGFMKNWSDGDDSAECNWRLERRDAMTIANQLGIEFHTFDFEKEYRRLVYDYMINEYKSGRTPNPDVLCNKYLKFDLFLKEADKLNCDFLATGHYAQVHEDQTGTVHLLSALDQTKDQTYFLCQLNQDQLKRTLFPIGSLKKTEVRKIAKHHNLSVATKKDSQGICFIGKVELKDFLSTKIARHSGNIITTDGEIIGHHQGFEYYTIGQRSGLGIGGGIPYYVVERRSITNEVVVATGANHPALFQLTLTATDLTETVPGHLIRLANQPLRARIRYRQPLARCSYSLTNQPANLNHSEEVLFASVNPQTIVSVTFITPQRAVASGQFIAFYLGEELIGSGVIS